MYRPCTCSWQKNPNPFYCITLGLDNMRFFGAINDVFKYKLLIFCYDTFNYFKWIEKYWCLHIIINIYK